MTSLFVSNLHLAGCLAGVLGAAAAQPLLAQVDPLHRRRLQGAGGAGEHKEEFEIDGHLSSLASPHSFLACLLSFQGLIVVIFCIA